MADSSLAALLARTNWVNGPGYQPPQARGDVPSDQAPVLGLVEPDDGRPPPPPEPAPEPRRQQRRKPRRDDSDAFRRIIASIVYTQAVPYKLSPGVVPLAKLGLNINGDRENGIPVGLDTTKLQAGDLEALSAYLARQGKGGAG